MIANPETKSITGQVEGTALPSGSSIGVTLIKTGASDGKYDNSTYNNVEYHSDDGVAWGIVTGSVLLSGTEGTVYGYYPYSDAVTNIKAVPISATDGKDYMYATPRTGVKNSNASVDLAMNHALSVIQFTIGKASTNGYTGSGNITSVKLEGATLGSSGTMETTSGTVSATAGALTYNTAMSLGDTGELFAVPTGTASGIKFTVSMDGQTYTATTGAVTLAQGQQYTYTLNMSSTGLTVSTVSVNPWGEEQPIGGGSGDAELYDPWTVAKATNGVYAIDDDGNPVDYTTASAASTGTYKSVALVIDGEVIEIASEDASESSKWAETQPMSDEEVEFFSSNYIRAVIYAMEDMDGKGNTERILAANVTIASVINSYNDGSHGSTDWYLPSLGQFYHIFNNKSQIDDLLTKMFGTAMGSNNFWSSTVCNENLVYLATFGAGTPSIGGNVMSTYRVRLVRDL